MKKLICILIAMCMVFTLTACRDTEDTQSGESAPLSAEDTGGDKEITLLYSASDTFNPYTAVTETNRQLALLLFDPLVKTDNNFEIKLCLAASVENTEKVCTVRLRDAVFSDGSAVTAQDVVYSYNIARESATDYAARFYEVESVVAEGNSVIFNLTQHDPYFANLLDFPIIKADTSGITDSDGVETIPVGCGRYIFDEAAAALRINEKYYGAKGEIGEIKLINSPDADSTAHYVEVGATDLYYTDADDGNIARMSGKKSNVNINRLVYIGINSSYGSLQTKEMRYAISSAIDRQAVCQTAFYNDAVSATGFLNPNFTAAAAVQTIKPTPDIEITVENLGKIGYNNMTAEGYYANSAGNNPVFTLLVNSENASRVAAAHMIAAQCKTAGIEIMVIERSYEQYMQLLSSNGFQLYLGEIQVLPNMDLKQLTVSGGTAAYGVSGGTTADTADSEDADGEAEAPTEPTQKSNCTAVFESYHSGTCAISDVAGTLLTEMPQIPICYRNGVFFNSDKITDGVVASHSDIYFSIENYQFK